MFLIRGVLTRTRILFALLIVTCLVIFNSELPSDLYFVKWTVYENITCYYDNTDDVLPPTEEFAFRPPPKSIFFHETSCRGGLNPRQACAVEAAAMANPDWTVHVLFMAPVKKFEGSMRTLRAIGNVRFARIHVDEYVKGTPAEDLVTSGALNRSRWRVSHTSDVLRYLTLFKWGGVYLDLDTVAVKSFNSLEKNWSARESDIAVAAGAMSFSRDWLGRYIASMAIMDLATNYRGDWWGHNGPGVITRVLKEVCFSDDVSTMTADTCKGFEVYSPELFYPIKWQEAEEYFKPGILDSPEVYIYHVWNRMTHDIDILKDSRYANLAKRYCRRIYHQFSEDFGVRAKEYNTNIHDW